MISTRTLARLGGFLYLAVAVFGAFSQSVRLSVKVPGDAAATAANIVQHATLFRIAFATDLVDFTCFLGVGLVMYAILKQVRPKVALAMLVINAVSVAIQALNMLNHLGALLVATEPGYTAGLSPEASHSLVTLLLNMHQQGYLIAQIFFGLYLLPLGYLVYRSGFFPKVLGVVLMIGCFGYVAGVPVSFFSSAESSLSLYFGLVGGLAELLFLLWLLIMGAKTPRAEVQPTKSIQGALTWKA